MRSSFAAVALAAGYAVASPAAAPQLPDFNLIYAAPSPSLVGPPPIGTTDQTNVFNEPLLKCFYLQKFLSSIDDSDGI